MADKIVITLTGNASQLIGELNKAGVAVTKFDSTADNAAKSTSKFGGEMAALGKSLIAPLAFTAIAAGVKQWSDEAEALGRNFVTQRNLLSNLLGGTEAYNQAMADATLATQGLVSQSDLAKSSFLLLKSGLADNATEAGELALVGNVLSQTYEANGATFEKFLRLLQQGSPILLDNFALTLGEVNARKELITTTEGLTGNEAKLVAIKQLVTEEGNRVIAAMSDEQRTALELDAAMVNLKTTIGEQLVPAYNIWREAQIDIVGGLGDANTNISNFLGLLGNLSPAIATNTENTVTWADALTKTIFPFSSLIVQSDVFGAGLESTTRLLIENTIGYEALAEQMGLVTTQGDLVAQMNRDLAIAEGQYQTILLDTIKAHNENALAMVKFVDEAQSLREKDAESLSKHTQKMVEINNKGQAEIRDIETKTGKEKENINKDFEKRRQDIIKNAMMFDQSTLNQKLDDLEKERIESVKIAEKTGEEKITVQKKTIEQEKMMQEQARAEEKQAQEKHMNELLLKMTLQRAEATGELERLTGVAGISAEDAFAAAQAGMLNISDALSKEVGIMAASFNASSDQLAKTQDMNSVKIRQSIENAAKDGVTATGKSFLLIQEDADKTSQKLSDVWDTAEIESYREVFGDNTDEIIRKLELWRKKAVEVDSAMRNISTTGGGNTPGFASGGSFIVPPGYPNDTFMMGVTSGEKVDVQPTTNVNNFNLNVNSSMQSAGLSQDFQMMKILAGM